MAKGGGVCNSFIQGTWHSAERTIHIWVYMYMVQLSITGACNSFYTICTLHCTLDMLQGAAGACNSFYTGYMAWCTMHVAGYHRGMQGNFLAVMGQEMSHAPTPKQPICNVFMDLQYICHILTHPKGDSYFL